MIRGRSPRETSAAGGAPALDDFHEWVLSLPWVVERPYSLGARGVRSFAVDCEPLQRRRLWLVTGLEPRQHAKSIGVAVILPLEEAHNVERAGCGRRVAPMPAGHVLMTICSDAADRAPDIERVAISAYSYAMS
jgi:hypothetical protein